MEERFIIREKTVFEIIDLDPAEDGIEIGEDEERIVGVYESDDEANRMLMEFNSREVSNA